VIFSPQPTGSRRARIHPRLCYRFRHHGVEERTVPVFSHLATPFKVVLRLHLELA
jgi:hypothetical protein